MRVYAVIFRMLINNSIRNYKHNNKDSTFQCLKFS
ncbi:hypothetical protein C3B55_00936 [Candidatus Pseudomonas adelgestsugas]|uniref:Uncharacterized protein n=1 Tax=Candidatus Pseudomonas adelgestsugas TaxID=1302376 RepID=A0ABX5R9J6_9PSED|nr:hypothetical protein C3B55_00936 [Candidatus Pseudomonas adelgestsugas]